MDTILYEKLIQLAKDGDLAAYSDVAPLIDLDMSQEQDRDIIAKKLGDIADHEEAADRPMLTALIVHYGNDNNPGEGFFAKAVELGRYNGSRDPLRRLTFWANQVRDIYECWQAA